MKLIRSIIEVIYDETPQAFSYKKRLLASVGVNISEDLKLSDALNVRVEDQHGHILIDSQRVNIAVERLNHKKSKDFLINAFVKVNSELKLQRVKRFGYRSMFIEETSDNFDKLVQAYKGSFFTNSDLIEQADDIGVPLTFNKKGYRLSFSTGPMEEEQILSLIEYPVGLSYKNSIFVDIDYGKTDVATDIKTINQMIDEALSEQTYLTKKVQEMLYE